VPCNHRAEHTHAQRHHGSAAPFSSQSRESQRGERAPLRLQV
jgi:hypothetical protein